MVNTLIDLWTFITAWYNLPFTLALLAFLALSALQFLGLEHSHDTDIHADLDHDLDVDHDLDIDHDLDVDHDLDIDHDADLDHDLDHDVDHDVDHDLGHDTDGVPVWASALQFLGAGYAPMTMVLLVLLGGFGFLGWTINAGIVGITPVYTCWMLLPVLAGALRLGAWVTSRTSRLIDRVVPAFASTATSVTRLVGRRGYVASAHVDSTYGQVKVRDSGGTLLTVFAVVDLNRPPIPRDTEVYLVEYNADKKIFVVVPSE